MFKAGKAMIYMQKLPYSEANLIVGGKAYHFDSSGFYRDVRDFRFINLIPVSAVSYLTQGNQAEKVVINDYGKVETRYTITATDLVTEVRSARTHKSFAGLLLKNNTRGNVSSTQYIVLHRK